MNSFKKTLGILSLSALSITRNNTLKLTKHADMLRKTTKLS